MKGYKGVMCSPHPALVFLSLSIFVQRVILNQHFTITGIKRNTKSYENAESSRELGGDDW